MEAFTAVLGSFSVVIEVHGLAGPELRVLDKSGNEIDGLDGGSREGRKWRDPLSDLYDKARRAALDVEGQLDEC